MLGAPASGKGTQAALLASHFDLPNLSTGALIRAEQQRGSALGVLADQYLAGGGFLPDSLMIDLIEAWLDDRGQGGFILDGFPRTLPQALAFEQMLAARGQEVDAVVLLDVDLPTLQLRIARRLECERCGAVLREGASSFLRGAPCPKPACPGILATRRDDEPQTYAARLANYHRLTEPLVQHYAGGPLRRIDGRGTSDLVFDEILGHLGALPIARRI